MKKNRLIYIVLIIAMLIGASSCEGKDVEDTGAGTGPAVEESEKTDHDETLDSTEITDQPDMVAPEFDENGNPTGEYARYLWEQQQMEEAMNSLVEDAMTEQNEEDFETHVFPLD